MLEDTTILVYLNNRYHDPTLGSFISVDPLVSMTGEAYIYGAANPISYSDPSGLCSVISGEVWCTNATGYWFNYSDPNYGPAREAARADAAGSLDVTLEASFAPVIGEMIDGADCLGGSKLSCVMLPLPFFGGRFLDEIGDIAGGLIRGSDEAADAVQTTGRWLRGTSGNAGRVPDSVRAALDGQTYSSWRTFKSDFWKAAAADPDLAAEFTDESLAQMLKGNAPFVDPSQVYGGNSRYVLHHVTPKSRGGGEFDLSNIIVVTPRYHREVLSGGYHYGGRGVLVMGVEPISDRAELVQLVARLRVDDFATEEETDEALALFEASVPHPRAMGLIFHWNLEFSARPTDEQIVDRALSYRAIEL